MSKLLQRAQRGSAGCHDDQPPRELQLLESGRVAAAQRLKLLLITHALMLHEGQVESISQILTEQRNDEWERLWATAAAKLVPLEAARDAEIAKVMVAARKRCAAKITAKYESTLHRSNPSVATCNATRTVATQNPLMRSSSARSPQRPRFTTQRTKGDKCRSAPGVWPTLRRPPSPPPSLAATLLRRHRRHRRPRHRHVHLRHHPLHRRHLLRLRLCHLH